MHSLLVASVIVRDHDLVLLQHRIGGMFAGRWSLPGGKLDPGEDFHTGGRRELFEETGIIAHDTVLLNTYQHTHDDVSWVGAILLATRWSGSPRNLEPTKHSVVEWCDIYDIPELTPKDQEFATARRNLWTMRQDGPTWGRILELNIK